jgi:hypothetical protein
LYYDRLARDTPARAECYPPEAELGSFYVTSNTMRLRWAYCAFFFVGLIFNAILSSDTAAAQAGKFYAGASAESMVSRLSDAEVRELLLQRLQTAEFLCAIGI